MEWTYTIPENRESGDKEEVAALSANVRALNVIIGLLVKRYPENLAPQYIRECVQLKQLGELDRNEDDALKYMSSVYGAELFCQLVNLFEEADAERDAAAAAKSPQDPEDAAKAQREKERMAKAEADRVPAAKTASGKTTAKKQTAKKAPAKKTGGAADAG